MIRTILEVPHKALKKKSTQVEKISEEIKILITDMFETMYDAPGVGLAAPQLGVHKRIIVIDTSPKDQPPEPYVMINPVIVKCSKMCVLHNEGCLSVPDEYADVERFETIAVSYLNEKGQEKTLHTDGLLAIAIQHEIDHLDGKLFIDYLSKIKRDMLVRRIEKTRRLEKEQAIKGQE